MARRRAATRAADIERREEPGDEITGISFQAGILYLEDPPGSEMYPPQPGSFEIAIDNLAFSP